MNQTVSPSLHSFRVNKLDLVVLKKLVSLGNRRDDTEKRNEIENKYFLYLNDLLDEGWTVSHLTQNAVEIGKNQTVCKEIFAAFVLFEKPVEQNE